MDIYLVILKDRHIDVQIRPFVEFPRALKKLINWQSDYQNEEWIEVDKTGNILFAQRSCNEDGPSIRIEKQELVGKLP